MENLISIDTGTTTTILKDYWRNANSPVEAVGAAVLVLLDSPFDHFFVAKDGLFVHIQTPHGFKDKIKELFADDPKLLAYIHSNKINMDYLPYLVRMYNGHAPRLFDPDYKSEPEFIQDGLIDERDGQSYDILIINNVSWMAEDLHYCDPKWDCAKLLPNPYLYYPWLTAIRKCPIGWRVPDETDWKTLLLGLGSPLEKILKYDLDKEAVLGPKFLKDTLNPTGFNAHQSGADKNVRYWMDKEASGQNAWVIEIKSSDDNKLGRSIQEKSKLLSVRCVKQSIAKKN